MINIVDIFRNTRPHELFRYTGQSLFGPHVARCRIPMASNHNLFAFINVHNKPNLWRVNTLLDYNQHSKRWALRSILNCDTNDLTTSCTHNRIITAHESYLTPILLLEVQDSVLHHQFLRLPSNATLVVLGAASWISLSGEIKNRPSPPVQLLPLDRRRPSGLRCSAPSATDLSR